MWIAGSSGSFADNDCEWAGPASRRRAIAAASVRRCDGAQAFKCDGCEALEQRDFRYAALMRLKIRRLDSTISLPTYATEEAAGFDLAASQDVRLAPGQIALVPTGLVIEVPSGHFLAIFARSSTPLKRGLIVA